MAAQADAALSSNLLIGSDEDGAAQLLATSPLGPQARGLAEMQVDMEALWRSAEQGNLEELARVDTRLKGLLESGQLSSFKVADLADPEARAALKLYRDSFMALASSGRDLVREAFQAVARDDAARLQALLDGGVSRDSTNAGGDSLMDVAQQRCSFACLDLMERHCHGSSS